MPLQLKSDAFAPNDPIPRKYTGDAEDVSPPLTWSGVPAGAKSLALIVEDPDAPRPVPWLHWTIYGMPAEATGLPENVPKHPTLTTPVAARQGVTDFGQVGYGGPAPPRGHGVHHYHFRLYALDAPLTLAAGADLSALRAAMRGHVLDETDLVGTYERRR
jgi:Raf kinase inhibitor-like YbhB/YbcL family protein